MSERPTVGVDGDGPAVEAIESALGDAGYEPTTIQPSTAGAVDLAVVVATAGTDRFDATDRQRDGPWLAVELGGIGGLTIDDIDASVAVLDGGGPCYRCLVARVRSTAADVPTDNGSIRRSIARLAGAHAGQLALDQLDGGDEIGRIVELPYAERQLLPLPACACDRGQPRAVDHSHEPVDLETTVSRAERAVDPRLGPVESIGEIESFPAPYYLATICDTTGFSDGRASDHAAGVAVDWNAAFVKAVGEGLERYSAGVYRADRFDVAPASSLDDAVSPTRFVTPETSVDPDVPIPWVPGENLHTGEPVSLPAERIQFPPPEKRFGPAITTGLGLGTSGVGALRSGLTEVIERDATMLAWYSTYEPLALSVDDSTFDVMVRRARSEDLAVTTLLVTQDVDVPVVTVAVHRDGDWPQFAVGSGAALDPTAAARAAVQEALQNWMELRGLGPDGAAREEPILARYADFPPEARGFVTSGDAVPARSVGPEDPPSGVNAIEALLHRVDAAGLTAYAARITPRDVTALGFEAVRVVVPEAQPLFTGERFFGERARTVPRELGFRPRLDRPPHPYP